MDGRNPKYFEKEPNEHDPRESSNSALTNGLERLKAARDAAYLKADEFKIAGNAGAEALCFGEGVGLEKAAMLIYGQAI
jgi:hypothetical protein